MQTRKVLFGLSVVLAVFLAAAIQPMVAQSTRAAISGTVSDASGAVMAGAHVVVQNTETGAQRAVTTDDKGSFLVSDLAPGPYQVTVSQPGFETLVRTGINLQLGQQASLPLALKIGAVSEQITVSEEAPLVNTNSSSVAGVVDQQRIEELPLNGRDFSQLPLIQPGVAAIRNGDVTVSKGYGARIAMGGSRPDQTAWLLDGTNINSPSNFGTPGSAAGVMLGVDAVREFQVLTSDYKAELGGTSGGVINMITKSGTNSIHGSAYEYLRNSKLDARNFFDPAKPPFKRNQFGASIGGPIKKDRTFFFGNYEGLQQRQGLTNLATVPDANAHNGIVPGVGQVTIAPEIRPFLDLWPLPNGNSRGGGIALLTSTNGSSVSENYFVVRGDHHINDRQSIFARVTVDQGGFTQPDQVPVFQNKVSVHSRYATVQHDFILSPQFLMTSRIAFNRTLNASNELPIVTMPASLNVLAPNYPPTITFSGATTIGPNGTNLIGRVQNLYAYQEDVQYIRGAHSIRFGGEYIHIGSNIFNQLGQFNGQLTWSTLQDFLTDNRLSAFSGVATGSDPYRSFRQSVFAGYVQDDWKMRPNFTWNLGVRYEPFTTPGEKYNRLSSVDDWRTATRFRTDIGLFNNPSKKSISPRVGFAWDPQNNGKTAVRAGFGVFYVDLLSAYYGTPGGKNPPFAASTASVFGNLSQSITQLTLLAPSLLSPVMTPNTLMDMIPHNLKASYEMKFNLSLERQLPAGMSLTVGFLGNRGVHLWRLDDANDPYPTIINGRPFVSSTALRPNTNVGVGTIRYSDAQSFYNGLQMELKKRISHGFQFQTSYTFSKNVDDSTTGVAQTDFVPGGVGNTNQPNNPKADRALSSLNIGQTFVANGIYNIPSPAHSGIASLLTSGWQMASIFTANSGAPLSVYVSGRSAPDQSRQVGVQRPDLVAGRSNGNIVSGTTAGCGSGTSAVKAGQQLGTPSLYFDPCAFIAPPTGFYGNAGRNILLGPGLMNFDFSLLKSTPLKFREGARLEFHGDFFNVLNRANFANPRAAQSQVINATNGAYIPTAGAILSTVTSSRQMQFGLKLLF